MKVFVPLTDDILYNHPEWIDYEIIPYHCDLQNLCLLRSELPAASDATRRDMPPGGAAGVD